MPDPVLWLKTDKPYDGQFRRARVWDEKKQEWYTPVHEKGHPKAGRPMMERVPGTGFDGEPSRATPMKQRRFVEYLRHDGHEVSVPIRNAAAHVQREDTSCETDRRLKAKYFAWVEKGTCPVNMLANGVPAEKFVTDTTKWGQQCDVRDLGLKNPPCRHYLEEKKARQGHRADETAETEKKYASEAEKHTEAIKAMGDGMAAAVGEAVKQALLSGQSTGAKK